MGGCFAAHRRQASSYKHRTDLQDDAAVVGAGSSDRRTAAMGRKAAPGSNAQTAPSKPICQKSASSFEAWPKIPASSTKRCSVMLRAASSSRCLRAAAATL